MKVATLSDRNEVFQRNPDLIGALIDNELVMMSAEKGQYYGLAGVGLRIWELLEQPRGFDQLVDQILDEFEVGREECQQDMAQFLKQMLELGLVKRLK